MPIYEYACPDCRKIFSFLVRGAEKKQLPCPRCGRRGLKRIYSPFALTHSEESRLEKLADPANFAALDENDPRAMARLMRKMARETGEELDDETREVVERLEAGEDPEQLEKKLGQSDSGYTRDSSGTLYE